MSKQKKESSITTEPAVPSPGFRSRNKLLIIITLAVLIAGIVLAVIRQRTGSKHQATGPAAAGTPGELLDDLSRLDMSGAEKQVAEKINQLIREAKDNSTSAHAWGKLAMNLDVHDFKNESVPCYKEAARLNPEDFRWPYYGAIVLSEMGSPEALPMFQRSVALRPQYAPVHIRYGQKLLDAGRPAEAGAEFRQALVHDSKSAHAYFGLARIDLLENKLEACIKNLEEVLKINPRFAEAHGLAAEVLRRNKQMQEANQELQISQQLPKTTTLPDEVMGELSSEGVSSYWYDIRGRAYMDQGAFEAAVRELTKAVEAAPSPRLHNTLGAAYMSLQKYQEAEAQHRAALALNPQSIHSMNNLAAALFELGKRDEAVALLQKAIQTEPGMPHSYLHLASLYLRMGNRKAVIETYRSGNRQLPKNPQIALQLAWHLATTPQPALRNGLEAAQLAEALAQQTRFQEPMILDVLAAAYAEIGKYSEAVKVASHAQKSASPEIAKRIQQHLKFYEAGKPYHE